MPHTFPLSRIVQLIVLTVLLSLLGLSGGCVTGRSGSSLPDGPGSASGLPADEPEELVEAPRLPEDDGIPLNPEEKAAMKSTGVLDTCLTPADMPYVELHFKFFTRKNRKTFERFLARSEPYLPYVMHVFKSRGIPEEVAYLAYVESGFNPNAISPAGAGGMWQFMPYTGKKYGLAQDTWMDERRDPFKATHAAADYLLKLHGDFGDWLLALAAYNAGEGKIARALAGTQASDFFGICRKNDVLEGKAQLKDETMQYVPRLLAVTKIMRNLEPLGFKRPDPARAHTVVPVAVGGGTDLRGLARTSTMSWEQFTALNPAFRATVSPPTRQTTAYVPFEQESKTTAWLSSKESRIYANWKDYKVRKGESLASVAKRHGTSVAMLRQANGRSGNAVKPGETILVPGSARAAQLAAASMPAQERGDGPSAKPKGGYRGIHEVSTGDTLYALSLQWGTNVDAIRSLNGLSKTDPLQVGQTLYVPGGKNQPVATAKNDQEAAKAKSSGGLVREAKAATLPAKAADKSAPSYVVVKEGDTLYSLARTYECSVDELCYANNIKPGNALKVGQKLRLSGTAEKAPAQTKGTKTSSKQERTPEAKFALVQPGDTLSTLARQNNTTVAALAKLNGLKTTTALRQGQLIKLP